MAPLAKYFVSACILNFFTSLRYFLGSFSDLQLAGPAVEKVGKVGRNQLSSAGYLITGAMRMWEGSLSPR